MIYFPDTPEEFANAKCYCNSWVATAVVGAAAVGGAAKIFAAKTAADAQVGAAGQASATLKEAALHAQNALDYHNNIAQSYLQPYRDLGQTGINTLTDKLTGLTTPIPISQEQLDLQKPLQVSQEQLDLEKPIQLTQEQLEKTPGYEFTKTQGLKSVQNSAAARGLGVSGAALKGAATFSTGLADKTWQDVFSAEMANRQGAFGRYANTFSQQQAERTNAFGRYGQTWQQQVTGQQTAYDRLMGIIGAGETAGTYGGILEQKTGQGTATALTDAGKGVAGTTIGAGNAEAASTNAIGGAISDAANNIGGYAAYKGLYGGGVPNAPNLSYTKGIAGGQFVPTYS